MRVSTDSQESVLKTVKDSEMREVEVIGMLHGELFPDGSVTLRLGEATIPLTAEQVEILAAFLFNTAAKGEL